MFQQMVRESRQYRPCSRILTNAATSFRKLHTALIQSRARSKCIYTAYFVRGSCTPAYLSGRNDFVDFACFANSFSHINKNAWLRR